MQNHLVGRKRDSNAFGAALGGQAVLRAGAFLSFPPSFFPSGHTDMIIGTLVNILGSWKWKPCDKLAEQKDKGILGLR